MKSNRADLFTVRFPFAASFFLSLFFLVSPTADAQSPSAPEVRIPEEFGRVIYQSNPESPNQVFIIGTSHRDTFDKTNGDTTVQAQIEVYRIGEWLATSTGLELLLPEGYFSRPSTSPARNSIPDGKNLVQKASYDANTLAERLGNNSVYVNAEMLLTESHGLRLRQVEDFDLYDKVRRRMAAMIQKGPDTALSFFARADLEYLQDLRTAVMIQKIPAIIEQEYQTGNISGPRAAFTIGLSHVAWIMRYLDEKRISIKSPAFAKFDDYQDDLNLLKRNFGVTIIIPRSIAENKELLSVLKLAR